MKKWFSLFLLLAALAPMGFAAGKAEAQSTSSTAADTAAISALWSNYCQDVMNGNLDAFLALHAQDAYKMPQDQPMFQIWTARDGVAASWKKRLETLDTEMSISPKETVIMGDYAYSMGVYSQVFTPKAGGSPSKFDGKFLTVLHKDAEGNWKILRDCYNSNVPPTQ